MRRLSCIVLLVLSGFFCWGWADAADIIFDNWNVYGVANGPTQATRFTLQQPAFIEEIVNYHWNNGRGAAPGWITLKGDSGRIWGPWKVTTTPGQGGVPNAVWHARPGTTLQPGTYTVVDSHPESWSRNNQSGGQGFVRVMGRTVGSATPLGGFGFTRTPNAAISGYNNKHLSGVSPEDCARACLSETSFLCKSFDYYKNDRACDLSSRSAAEVGGLKTDYSGNPYDHYAREGFESSPSPGTSTPHGFTRTPNAAISGYNNKHLSGVSPADCARACLNETSFLCKSFDYYKNDRACDLSSRSAAEVGGLKTDYSGNPYDHYERVGGGE